MTEFDLLVIGAGSGGVRAARMAATYGAKVAICEEARLGGTCVNVGCIPKKLLVYGAHFADECRDARDYGWQVQTPSHDWATLIERKNQEIARLNGVYQTLLESRGVTILRGRGVLAGPGQVDVALGGTVRRVTAKNILLATGGTPTRPSIPGAEHVMVSDDMFALPRLPRRVLIIGGGYIAVEFAGIFSGLGAQVTQVYRGRLFLRGFDSDLRNHLAGQMRENGIDLRFHRDVARVDKRNDVLRAVLDDGSVLEVDAILAALGRTPRTEGLGLAEVGIAQSSRGAVLVDRTFRTSVPGIYAVGDVIDRIQLTPVALAEAMIVAQHLFSDNTQGCAQPQEPDYDFIPSAVFSNPPIGTVGYTEEEALAACGSIDIYKSTFTPLKQAVCAHKGKTLMKLVVDASSQRVVGLHMVGPDAGEIVQGFAVALKCGAKKTDFDRTIGIHPTAAEEFVTMRERVSTPDAGREVRHEDATKPPRIVHHRWDDKETC